jgi:hypothetical protein
VGPVEPVSPVVPVGPVEPVIPVGPVEPVSPVIPVAPVGPVEPVVPVGPVGPVGPVIPVGPTLPLLPGGPTRPICPIGPVLPVIPVPYPNKVFGVTVNVLTPFVMINKFVVMPELNKKFVEKFIVPSPIALIGMSKIVLDKLPYIVYDWRQSIR